MEILVLGAGLVGRPMALDLAREEGFSVTLADVSTAALDRARADDPRIVTVRRDLSDPAAVRELAAGRGLVLSAVPGPLGFRTLEAAIGAGVPVVDIAFFEEDPFALDAAAREQGTVAVVDSGVAPGLSNLLVGHADRLLDRTESVRILVGGLPVERTWPHEYKAPFSPVDVLAEYTRPARLVRRGELVVLPALSEPELVAFPGIGTLEAVVTDGLRTLARTIRAPEMVEKTLRYPGHAARMVELREIGLLSDREIDVRGVRVRPVDVAAALLFPRWKLGEGEEDFTVMQVEVAGEKDGERVRFTFDLLDRYDPATRVHSMARTTGYTAAAVARLLAAGRWREPGVNPPETLGRDPALVEFVLAELAERGVRVAEKVERERRTAGGAETEAAR